MLNSSISCGLLSLAVLFCGCCSPSKGMGLTERKAETLAVKLANQESQRRFHIEPFTAESGYLVFATDCWTWQAVTSVGGHDFVARVSCQQGGTPNVEVDIQYSGLAGPPIPKKGIEKSVNPAVIPEIVKEAR